jgi:hypothetical protein
MNKTFKKTIALFVFADNEKPYSEWNESELICFEDRSIHIVNGHVVMALRNSGVHIAENDEPSLPREKIPLQSKYSEAYHDTYKFNQSKLCRNGTQNISKAFIN